MATEKYKTARNDTKNAKNLEENLPRQRITSKLKDDAKIMKRWAKLTEEIRNEM